MGEIGLIIQLGSGELVLGEIGEQMVSHYTFYAVFKTYEEYRIVVEGKTLGTLPIDSFLLPEQHIVFGGRRWKIKEIDADRKTILVTPAKGGKPPKFRGDGMSVHDRIRQEMYEIYRSGDYRIAVGETKLEFLDRAGKDLFQEGLKHFKDTNLETERIFQDGKNVYIVPWMGDKLVNTLVVMLNQSSYKAYSYAGIVEIENANAGEIKEYFGIIASSPVPSNTYLAESVVNKQTEKYDHLLPESLLNVAYGEKAFDSKQTVLWLSEIMSKVRAD